MVPSPPSAVGKTLMSGSGCDIRMPSLTALPASVDVRLPLKESMAMTIFIKTPYEGSDWIIALKGSNLFVMTQSAHNRGKTYTYY